MNPLNAILNAYKTAMSAMKVVRRCTTLGTIEEDSPFRNTRFHRVDKDKNLSLLTEAEDELADLTVLSLYATFEKQIKEYLSAQSSLLHTAAGPHRDFGTSLSEMYSNWASDSLRMDRAVDLFRSTVGETLIAQVGQIRKYRHWVAHGRRAAPKPPSTDPQWAYDILTQFLTLAGLAT